MLLVPLSIVKRILKKHEHCKRVRKRYGIPARKAKKENQNLYRWIWQVCNSKNDQRISHYRKWEPNFTIVISNSVCTNGFVLVQGGPFPAWRRNAGRAGSIQSAVCRASVPVPVADNRLPPWIIAFVCFC
jgi:hypothetical protein